MGLASAPEDFKMLKGADNGCKPDLYFSAESRKKAEEKYGWYEYDEAIERMAFKEEAEFLRKHKEAMTKQADNMN